MTEWETSTHWFTVTKGEEREWSKTFEKLDQNISRTHKWRGKKFLRMLRNTKEYK